LSQQLQYHDQCCFEQEFSEKCLVKQCFQTELHTILLHKILGLSWNAETDLLQFISRFRSLHEWGNRKTETIVENWTKRLILKAFDKIKSQDRNCYSKIVKKIETIFSQLPKLFTRSKALGSLFSGGYNSVENAVNE
jgi:hypothetical protein